MKPTETHVTALIRNEVCDSSRKVRYYGYLARHLTRINNALQLSGVISTFMALFTLLGDLQIPSLILLGIASFTLTYSALRNYSTRALRCSEVSQQFARLHLDWQELWNNALDHYDSTMIDQWKQLRERQAAVLEYIPLDLTLSPRLARRSQYVSRQYWTPALHPEPTPCGTISDQARSR